MDLTDRQWSVISPLIPEPPRRADGKGRPWRDCREVMDGILWILRTGAAWYDLPDRYPPYQTCHRRFQLWVRSGVFDNVLQALANDLRDRGKLDLSECHIDGTFVIAKKGATRFGATRRGKGTKVMAVADGNGLPVAINIASASPHEVTLAEATVSKCFVPDKPERLIGDKAYDSDPLDFRMAAEYGIEMIAPHKLGWRKRQKTQDGRSLRRWKVERLFAWLQNFRRILVRYDYYAENFLGFVKLGCMFILLRRCL
ncbi:MAG: IS5 family transposase [Nitrososphaerales archaeon]